MCSSNKPSEHHNGGHFGSFGNFEDYEEKTDNSFVKLEKAIEAKVAYGQGNEPPQSRQRIHSKSRTHKVKIAKRSQRSSSGNDDSSVEFKQRKYFIHPKNKAQPDERKAVEYYLSGHSGSSKVRNNSQDAAANAKLKTYAHKTITRLSSGSIEVRQNEKYTPKAKTPVAANDCAASQISISQKSQRSYGKYFIRSRSLQNKQKAVK